MIIASKGHIENVDSCDNPERVILSRVMASPMRKSTFPLDGSCLGSMCKFDFWVCFYVCLFQVYHPWFTLAIHDCAIEEIRIFKSCICNYLVEFSCWNVNFVMRTIIELWWTMKPGFLTDSFLVEFLNQVDNNRLKKKIGEKIYVYCLLVEIAYLCS